MLVRSERIRRRPEFLKVQRSGAQVRGRYLTLFALKNHTLVARMGVVATRKLGKATCRNKAKRLARELFRLNARPSGFDLVVMPRRGFIDAAFVDVEKDYRALLSRIKEQK
tara:strand:+ start:34129 stop:34461 length:333 start_codon:yes stop_codon:yes gene_type:complete